MSLKKIYLPDRYNYIACFLTLDCNFNCDYCINWFSGGNNHKWPIISGKDWTEALNRLVCPGDLPITLQGGEPSLHPDFIWIIKNIRPDLNIDILTNLSFDEDKFIKEINPLRIRRESPYSSIRVSYHPGQISLNILVEKVLKMQKAGFSIGIYGVLHPEFKGEILEARKKCNKLGIDFRTKEFLGEFNKEIYGTYRYPEAISNGREKKCLCRTSELIIGPNADIFRCHHDLYKNYPPIGNLLNPDFQIKDIFRECFHFGDCNPCDIKIKTNRFQIYGHMSVEIKDIEDG